MFRSHIDADQDQRLSSHIKGLVGRAFNIFYRIFGRQLQLVRSLCLLPSIVQIEITTKCNLRCKTCLRSHSSPNLNFDMNLNVFKSIIDQFADSQLMKPTIKLLGLGEPFLNPNLTFMVRYAKRKRFPVEMISNFTVASSKTLAELVEAQLDYLGVSLDGASPQTFEKIRVGARFDEVISNVKKILKARETMNSVKPKVEFRQTIYEDNVGEISELVELGRSLAVDSVSFEPQLKSGKNSFEYQDEYRDFLSANFEKPHATEISWVRHEAPVCPVMRKCYVTYDGKVMPCSFLMMLIPREDYPEFEFGDVTQNSLRSIWFSKKYKQFRVRKALGYHPYFCSSCPNVSGKN